MDAVKKLRRRDNSKLEPTTPEIRKCQYCKGQFEVNPQFPHKQFCKEAHRKLFWKYGSQSVGKLAERIERDMRKLIERETRELAAEIVRLQGRVDVLERWHGQLENGARESLMRLDAMEGGRGTAV